MNLPHPVENWYLLRLMGRIWNFASRDFLGIKIPPIKSFLNFFQVFLLSLQLEEWVWVSIFSMRIFLSFIVAFTMYIVRTSMANMAKFLYTHRSIWVAINAVCAGRALLSVRLSLGGNLTIHRHRHISQGEPLVYQTDWQYKSLIIRHILTRKVLTRSYNI